MGKVAFGESQTKENLAKAFAGECMAGARYQFLAEKCEKNKYQNLADTLKQLATNEMAHAKVFWNLLQKHCDCEGGIMHNIDLRGGYPFQEASIEEEFKFASQNESQEHKHIYPDFAETAREEGYKDVADMFHKIAHIEECHSKQLLEIADKFKKDMLYKEKQEIKWKCTKCGYEDYDKTAWKKCPVCEYDQGYVMVQLADE